MQEAPIFQLSNLRPLGRSPAPSASSPLLLYWAGSGLEVRFTGAALHLLLEADFQDMAPWIAVEVNGAPLLRMPLHRGTNDVCVFDSMAGGSVKHVRLFRETQPLAGDPGLRVTGLRWEGGAFLPLPEPAYRLEFVGDSLTSGEGVVGAREEEDWTPALFSASGTWARWTAERLGAEFRTVSQSGWGVRSSWAGDRSQVLPRIYEALCALAPEGCVPWDFTAWQPDAVIVNLGTNDAAALGSHPALEDIQAVEDAAVAFLHQLRRCNPAAKLVWAYGMAGDQLRPVLERAAARFGDAFYLPLPPVTAETMGSRQHPGPACHQEAAQTAAEFLKSILIP